MRGIPTAISTYRCSAGVVLLAFGVQTTLRDVGEPLDVVPAVALCGGTALYLLGHVAFLFRATRYLFRRRTLGAVVLLALIPAAITMCAGRVMRPLNDS